MSLYKIIYGSNPKKGTKTEKNKEENKEGKEDDDYFYYLSFKFH